MLEPDQWNSVLGRGQWARSTVQLVCVDMSLHRLHCSLFAISDAERGRQNRIAFTYA
jgi:hypothetical protein